VARAYAAGASGYAERFGDEFVTNDFDRDVLHRFLEPVVPGSMVLDGGCGPGQFATVAEEGGLQAVGVDITMEMLLIARDRLATPQFVCGDLRELPFQGAVFDAAVCWFSVHNLPRKLMPALLAEVRRVLIVGGRFLVATHEGGAEERFTDDVGETFVFTTTATPSWLDYSRTPGSPRSQPNDDNRSTANTRPRSCSHRRSPHDAPLVGNAASGVEWICVARRQVSSVQIAATATAKMRIAAAQRTMTRRSLGVSGRSRPPSFTQSIRVHPGRPLGR
jgi:SAM-dependent methyltransferase